MKPTLSIDPKNLEKAWATVNAMGPGQNERGRRCLETAAGACFKEDSFQELRELCLTRGGHSAGCAWIRVDLYRD